MEAPYGLDSYDFFAENFKQGRQMDAAIRCAESENDPEKFRTLIDMAFAHSERVNNVHAICLLLILMKNGKRELTNILKKKLEEWDKSYQPFRYCSPVDMAEIIKAMEFMSEDFVAESYSSPSQSYNIMPPDYINTPLYHAMIRGNSDYIERYIDIEMKNDNDLTSYMLSAICFRDTDFLKIAFRKGAKFESGIFISFCTDPESVAYLCDNFSEYIFPDKTADDDPRNNIQDFIRLTASAENLLFFEKRLFDDIGYEKFQSIVDKIPRANVMTQSVAQSVFYSASFLEIKPDEKPFKTFLKDLLCDNIVFVVENACSDMMFEIKNLLNSVGANVNISYDVYSRGVNCFCGQKLRSVRKFLKENNVLFDSGGFSQDLASLLDFNDESITKSIISNLWVNEDNIRNVVEYLTENKLYKALNAVNKFYSPVWV